MKGYVGLLMSYCFLILLRLRFYLLLLGLSRACYQKVAADCRIRDIQPHSQRAGGLGHRLRTGGELRQWLSLSV